MSELPRIPPSVPVQPTHPLRPSREAGRQPRRPRPEKPPHGRRDPREEEPGNAPETESPDPVNDSDRTDGDAPSPPPSGKARIDLRV